MFRFLLIILLIFSLSVNAEISVKSFRKLDNDMTARIDAPKKDQNGDVCAIIKVVTSQTGFTFDCGQLGVIATDPHPSEIWVYVPYGAKRISISHPYLGVLRDYMIPQSIEKACVYELVLTTGKVITTVDETIQSTYLVVDPSPNDAAVYINDQFKVNGVYSAKLKPGKYTYRVEAPLYHAEVGQIEITNQKKEMKVKLKPAFGFISISSSPEQDAKVIIDGKPSNQKTPCTSEQLASGRHTVQVMKEMYQPLTQTIDVKDGEITDKNFELKPNFATVNITSLPTAQLFLDNESVGMGSWQGRLKPGIYSIEARQDRYKTAKQDIDVSIGDSKLFSLQPTPIYGALDVQSKPYGATIYLDGKEYGTTPNQIDNLLIGEYTLTLEKKDHKPYTQQVIIKDGQTVQVSSNLPNTSGYSFSTNPSGATLTIDGEKAGKTPCTVSSLSDGNHVLVFSYKKSVITKIITVDGSKYNFDFDFPITAEERAQLKTYSSWQFGGIGITIPFISKPLDSKSNNGYCIFYAFGKRYGFYTKLTTNFLFDKMAYTTTNVPSNQYYKIDWYKNDKQYNRFGVVAGLVIKNDVVSPYGGIGYGLFNSFNLAGIYNYADNKLVDSGFISDNNTTKGIETNLGVFVTKSRFSLNIGTSAINTNYIELNLGLGIYF